jgi:glutathione S-transferase
VEPAILELSSAKMLDGDKPWSAERLPLVVDRVHVRLKQLSACLGDTEWFDGAFSVADVMMVHVIQRLKPSGIVNAYANLAAYIARAEARPAFQRAFAAQHAVFTAGQANG